MMSPKSKAESRALLKDHSTAPVAPFQVVAFPPWWILINPIAWFLWIVDFLLWLLTIVYPLMALRFWIKRCCKLESIDNHDVDDDDSEKARRRRAQLWEEDLLLSPFHNDHDENEEGTAWEIFETAVAEFGDKPYLGTRKYLGTHQPEGSRFPLKVFGETSWLTYNDVFERVISLGAALRALGLAPLPAGADLQRANGPHTILIFEDTCADWLTCALAAFSQSLTVATSYATLGIDAVADSLAETNAPLIVCNYKNVTKVAAVAPASLQFIIYTSNSVTEDEARTVPSAKGKRVISLEALLAQGREIRKRNDVAPTPPEASSIAVIMYTSGSTGKPKGVMISHRSIGTAVGSLRDALKPNDGQEFYLAYLPAAHILEFGAEIAMTSAGASIGYACPKSISSKGAVRKLDDGTINSTPGTENPPGAIQEYRPTVMAAVPIIWDTLKKGAEEEIGKRGAVVKFLFQVAYSAQYYASKRGTTCPLFYFLVFRRMHQLMGARLRLAVSGGGPISADVQGFIRTVFGCHIIQGYALTETCACGTVQDIDDPDDNVVGGPVAGVEIKLRSCDSKDDPTDREGRYYLAEDTEHIEGEPCLGRGEVCIRGPAVSDGYFKQPEKTREVFQEDGWFRTGDIGLWDNRGRLKIVDRLKNLVKLIGGEYIAIESMEKEYSTSPFVDSVNGGVMCFGDGSMRKPAALVQVKLSEIKSWARSNGYADDLDAMCNRKEAREVVLKSLQECAKKGKLGSNEVIATLRLICGTGPLDHATVRSPWTPENRCRTASNKLERRNIAQVFDAAIQEMKRECA